MERGRDLHGAPDDRLWHALTAHAVASLAGRRISFRGGADLWLVPTHPGPGGSTVEEIELVAFPPTRGADRGYYPEGGHLTTATFLERGHPLGEAGVDAQLG